MLTQCSEGVNVEAYDNLVEFLKVHCLDFQLLRFKPNQGLPPYLQFALLNMHLIPCNDYVSMSLSSTRMKTILTESGLPLPFLLKHQLSTIQSKGLYQSESYTLSFNDQYGFSDWIVSLLKEIDPNYQIENTLPAQLNHCDINQKTKASSVCLTPKECDLFEIHCLVNEYAYEREDNMSLLDDPVVNSFLKLYLFLNDKNHVLLLNEVVSISLDGFYKQQDVHKYTDLLLAISLGQSVDESFPEALSTIEQLCRLYKSGCSIGSYISFITLLSPGAQTRDYERVNLLKNYVEQRSAVRIADLFFKGRTIKIYNSLTFPTINANNTMLSSSVNLKHVLVRGKKVNVFDLF